MASVFDETKKLQQAAKGTDYTGRLTSSLPKVPVSGDSISSGTKIKTPTPTAKATTSGYKDKGLYDDAGLSAADQAKVDDFKRQYNEADAAYKAAKAAGDTAGMAAAKQRKDAAHAGAEGVRAGYGYSGGADGTEYLPTETPKQTAPQVTAPSYTPATDYSDYIRELNAAARRKSLAALDAAYQKNVLAIDAAKGQVSPQYAAAKNQAAAQAAIQKKNWQEQAAAAGISSGASGQAALTQGVALQRDLNELGKAESKDLAALELQRAQTETDYNNAIAQAKASGDYELAEQLYAEKVRVDEQNREAIALAWQQQLQALQFNYGVNQDQLDRADRLDELEYNRRLLAAQTAKEDDATKRSQLAEMAYLLAENTGDYSMFAGLGYTPEQIASLEEAWRNQRVVTSGSTTGKASTSGTGSSGKVQSGQVPQMTTSTIYQMLLDSGATDFGTAYATLIQSGYGNTAAQEMATYYADIFLPGRNSSKQSGLGQVGSGIAKGAVDAFKDAFFGQDTGTEASGAVEEPPTTSIRGIWDLGPVAQKVGDALSRGHMTAEAMVNTINTYKEQGLITEDEAIFLLQQVGMD